MLSREDNERLTRVGRGTPMGELMRRYWQPIAAVGQLDEHPTRPVRLMGEDLVLYRDAHGRHGLLDRHCAHRRADLCYGMVEDRGLRCHYHGWLFRRHGPPSRAAVRGDPLGPPLAPLIPDWDLYHQRGYKQIVFGRDSVQLVPGAGELDRPDPLRVASRELGDHAARPGSPAGAEAPQDRFHGVRLGVRVPAR